MKLKKKHEHSAGGIIFKQFGKHIKILLIKDKNDQWSFPKGLIEKGENPVATAQREIGEEVGLTNLEFVSKIDRIGYFYRFQDILVRKKIDFFLFKYRGSEILKPLAKEGISDAKWVTPAQALKMIGYVKTNKPVLEKAIWIGKKRLI